MRPLNHAALQSPGYGWQYPAVAYNVAGNLAHMVGMLPQALSPHLRERPSTSRPLRSVRKSSPVRAASLGSTSRHAGRRAAAPPSLADRLLEETEARFGPVRRPQDSDREGQAGSPFDPARRCCTASGVWREFVVDKLGEEAAS
ncbi:hypothetical protein GCM10010236_08470 [Streptomyces eurythermus]|nr:hypothetical protein GCM10010236_08470 [Streptomyces eurythermus]